MPVEWLEPKLDLLCQEYVLVQAWKKTASYIRYHNWFSDTLALDIAAVNLPSFLSEIRERLQSSQLWQNTPLRIVPAPKSQRWIVKDECWEPVEKAAFSRLRPLAHVDLADQVVASALMLCLADRVETLQGNPTGSISEVAKRKSVISYGNRLFCDTNGKMLRHRWGSTKLYRSFFHDYRTFLSRPEVANESIAHTEDKDVYVVHADLQQFYDRVRPNLLENALEQIRRKDDDPEFFSLAKSLLNWQWDARDQKEVHIYSEQAGLKDFARVALPQGLVASGFFANVVLLSFDQALKRSIGSQIADGVELEDACRYVDDMRILIKVNAGADFSTVGSAVSGWLSQLLEQEAPGLALSPEKTQVAALSGDNRPLVRQSTKMSRIQAAVSGGIDALGGEDVLDGIQGLMRAQEALSESDDNGWRFSPVPDVRDATVARFGAIRYRATFRSIRPLLQDDKFGEFKLAMNNPNSGEKFRAARTQQELDEDARAFALSLIHRWLNDPSNVRLLRIGLDLWPDATVLEDVLSKLRPFTEVGGQRKAPRRVAWYCLSEILRAGATETGLVPDKEALPARANLTAYRNLLREEATRLVALSPQTIPWYLRQQALLFLAAFDPASAPIVLPGTNPETRHYREFILFLRGETGRLLSSDFATLAVLARRAFMDGPAAVELVKHNLNPARKLQLAQRDPSFFLEVIGVEPKEMHFDGLPARVREDLSMSVDISEGNPVTLADSVLGKQPGALRNELSVLRFAKAFLEQWKEQQPAPEVITPGQILLNLAESDGVADVVSLQILGSRAGVSGSLYGLPTWSEASEGWRFQLGFLLRFILSGQPDFTRPVRSAHWKESESAYRPGESHWYQRLYSLFSGQPAFGDDWLPITDWCELFLLALLRWPGCRVPQDFEWITEGIDVVIKHITDRVLKLDKNTGRATRALILPLLAKRPTLKTNNRPLRACVVQTAIPIAKDFKPSDLKLNDPVVRRRHRNHLSAALAAVERMLALRETHKKGTDGRLDWLILPELAVHPDDVRTHLIPFARTHKAIILTGLTYEEVLLGQPLINSALWVIPEWSANHGLQIKIRRQGKAHLSPAEEAFNSGGVRLLQGFRPCQWLIGYPWSNAVDDRPIWLTAAICYDATDLGLAADLKNKSDVFAIPALNKDIKTFDQMALALHYHMFQLVVVANNGEHGGSNAYWPSSDVNIRQVFHTHGQPQAAISFLEIDNIRGFLERHDLGGPSADDWKHPPAG